MAVVVHDFIQPDIKVKDVNVVCNAVERGQTNSDGYLRFVVPVGVQQDCVLSKEGYHDTQASHALTPGNETLRASIIQILPPVPQHPNPAQGQLRLGGGCFRDDSGCVNPVYEHFGDAFSHYVRDPERVRIELDKIARVGYRGIRAWAILGGNYWAGREVGPRVTEGYWVKLEAFFNDLKARNLTAVWSMGDIGQIGITREAYMLNLANVDNRVGAIEWLDCGNEAWQTGLPEPDALSRCVTYFQNAGGDALLTLTSAPGEEKHELDAYSIAPANAYDVHGYRGGHFWDKIRHIFSIPYEIIPNKEFGIQSEPWGNGARVSVTSNKHEIDHETSALGAILSILSKQAWVHFSGEGVILERGLDVEAGFSNVAPAVRLLPKDVTTYDIFHHSGTRWASVRTLVPPSDDFRVDGRTDNDGRTVQIIYGPSGSHTFRVARTFNGQICDVGPVTCNVVSWGAGTSVNIDFIRGRLLVGRVN
jgi:hypothetical protein